MLCVGLPFLQSRKASVLVARAVHRANTSAVCPSDHCPVVREKTALCTSPFSPGQRFPLPQEAAQSRGGSEEPGWSPGAAQQPKTAPGTVQTIKKQVPSTHTNPAWRHISSGNKNLERFLFLHFLIILARNPAEMKLEERNQQDFFSCSLEEIKTRPSDLLRLRGTSH